MEHNYTVGEEFDPWGVTGFSCRVEASKPKPPPTTTAPPTTTTSTTTTTTPEPTTKPSNDTCPQPDPEMCRCGRIKQFPQFKSMKFGRVLQVPGSLMNRIIGGSEVVPHHYPWQLGITFRGFLFCAASLISRSHILTAAHCVDYLSGMGYKLHEVQVHFASHDMSKSSGDQCNYQVGVKEIHLHPHYTRANDFDMDFAVFQLDTQVNCSDYVSPVCLPESTTNAYDDKPATIAGWGTVDPDTGAIPSKLMKAKVTTLPHLVCKYNTSYQPKMITENMICAENGGKDSCWGDSGGPLITKEEKANEEAKFVQVGVTSWGIGCGQEGYPGVYSRVTKGLEWIKNILANDAVITTT